LLSDNVDLDEVESYCLVEEAFHLTGVVSAAAAAKLFYTKRLDAVRALFSLLHAHIVGYGSLADTTFNIIEGTNVELLKETNDNNETVVLKNLCREVKMSSVSFRDAMHGSLSQVENFNRELVPRVDCISRECLVSFFS